MFVCVFVCVCACARVTMERDLNTFAHGTRDAGRADSGTRHGFQTYSRDPTCRHGNIARNRCAQSDSRRRTQTYVRHHNMHISTGCCYDVCGPGKTLKNCGIKPIRFSRDNSTKSEIVRQRLRIGELRSSHTTRARSTTECIKYMSVEPNPTDVQRYGY